jgi:hypothetical protein
MKRQTRKQKQQQQQQQKQQQQQDNSKTQTRKQQHQQQQEQKQQHQRKQQQELQSFDFDYDFGIIKNNDISQIRMNQSNKNDNQHNSNLKQQSTERFNSKKNVQRKTFNGINKEMESSNPLAGSSFVDEEELDMSKMKFVDPMMILQQGLEEIGQTLRSTKRRFTVDDDDDEDQTIGGEMEVTTDRIKNKIFNAVKQSTFAKGNNKKKIVIEF